MYTYNYLFQSPFQVRKQISARLNRKNTHKKTGPQCVSRTNLMLLARIHCNCLSGSGEMDSVSVKIGRANGCSESRLTT